MARVITQDDLTPVAMLPDGDTWLMVIPLGMFVGDDDAALALGRVWTLEACPQ
jgi:hypothetical protein